jgi:hypothetical protein
MKMIFAFLSVLICYSCFAQPDFNQLSKKETELNRLVYSIVNDSTEKMRVASVVQFIPALVEALKLPDSFNYPFDSLRRNISILNSHDNSFRIFTWQLNRDKGGYRYYGAIQKNNLAKLDLIPLFDYSDSLTIKENFDERMATLESKTWFGAVYYNIIQKEVKGRTYYFLFGWDGNDLWSKKKLVDVLYFDEGKPMFGAPLFELEDDKIVNRFIMEFRGDATVTLNYSSEEKMIIYDHLIAPEDRLADLQFTFIPDGSYSGFKWKKGKWRFVEKLKVNAIGEFDKPPVPKPVNFDKEKKQMKSKVN